MQKVRKTAHELEAIVRAEAARKRPNKSQKATVNEKTGAKNKARESVK